MNMDIARQLIKHAHMQSKLDSLVWGDPEVIIGKQSNGTYIYVKL